MWQLHFQQNAFYFYVGGVLIIQGCLLAPAPMFTGYLGNLVNDISFPFTLGHCHFRWVFKSKWNNR